jgi:acyl-CoA synthetase (AMP-forming)/AMP-acid ligase II
MQPINARLGTAPFPTLCHRVMKVRQHDRLVTKPAQRLHTGAWAAAVSARAGLLGPFLPDQVIGMGLAVARYGRSLAGIFAAGAARTPRRSAVVDESGSLTYGELDDRTSTLAAGLADCGLDDGDRVGVLCRNHRGFVQASVALAKMGVDTVYLNAGMAEPQLAEVFEREGGSALIIDPDLLPLAASVPRRVLRIAASGPDGLEHLAGRDPRRAPPRRRDGAQILLTSGTTGSPRGARRGTAGVEEALALLDRIQHSAVTAAQLKDHVRARLARFKVPRDVVFVAELPRNASGKVVRRLLPP